MLHNWPFGCWLHHRCKMQPLPSSYIKLKKALPSCAFCPMWPASCYNQCHRLSAVSAAAFTKGWDMTLVILALTPLLALAGTSIAIALGRMDTASSKAYAGEGLPLQTLAFP